MRKLLAIATIPLLFAGAFSFAIADEIVYQQPVATDVVASFGPSASGSGFAYIPLNAEFLFTTVTMWMQSSTTDDFIVLVDCYTDSGVTLCPGWTQANTGPYRGMVLKGDVAATAGGSTVQFDEPLASTTAAFPSNGRLSLRVFPYDSTTARMIFGTSTPNYCTSNCTAGTPYMYVYGAQTQPSQVGTTSRIIQQIEPANGETSASTAVTFRFSWFNSGLELYSVAQTEISDVTSGFQYAPQQSSASVTGYGTTTQIYTLTANHLHLWRACLFNPGSGQKTCSPYRSLNVVGPSASSSVPVFPDVTEENASSTLQGSIWSFLNVYGLLQAKLPFAYFFQVADLMDELQSTTTEVVEPVIFDYASLDISSSTKNSLPARWEAFSTTTVTEWIPDQVLSAWRLLMSSVLWFGFAMYAYHRITTLFSGSSNTV